MPLARGVECPAQRAGGRAFIRRQDNKHDDCDYVGRHCQIFDRNGNASALQIQLQLSDSAEKIGTQRTRHGFQLANTTSARAIHPTPAVIPSVHWGTLIRLM